MGPLDDEDEEPEHLKKEPYPKIDPKVWLKMSPSQREEFIRQARLYSDLLRDESRANKRRFNGY